MSGSQVSTNSVTLMKEKEKSIRNLEDRIKELIKSSDPNPEKLAEDRHSLYGLFGDLLINHHPKYALDKNITDRMWSCTYDRILPVRLKLQNLKRKPEREQERNEVTQEFKMMIDDLIDFYAALKLHYVRFFDPEILESQSRSHDLSQDVEEMNKPSVVSILYKLLICLGDLYRYKKNAEDAFREYELATFLSPGQGNPYNQIAVLEITKDSSCNALYYYVRSIKASHKPFETSASNVRRLYSSNLKWLNDNNKAGVSNENHRKFLSKLFTAQFVELHGLLELGVDPKNKEKSNIPTKLKMDSIIQELEHFLSKNGLSDNFLCMMVAINAFSASECGALAQVLVFRFGTALADRVEVNLNKQLKAQGGNTVRCLAPLLITCDHILTFDLCEDEAFLSAEEIFWSKVCTIASKLNTTDHSLALEENSLKNQLPKEYQVLTGFVPFEHFISKPCEFISFEDARNLVPKVKDIKSRVKQDNMHTAYETRVKLARLLAILEEKSDCVMIGRDNCYRFLRELGSVNQESTEVISIPDDEVELISYKTPQPGSGPALLVPCAVASKSPSEVGGSILSLSILTSENRLIDNQHQSFVNCTAPQTEILPRKPPNRIASIPIPDEGPDDLPLAPPSGSTSSPGLKPPPGFVSLTQNSIFSPRDPDVWDFFSNIPTKNPFMKTRSFKRRKKIVKPEYTNNFLFPDEPTALLDSSLLRSLWGDDSKKPITKNPFFNHREQV